MNRIARRRALAAAGLLVVLAGVGVVAQVALPPTTQPSLSQVTVRESSVVAERMALAERMQRSQQWDKAADLLQEIIEKYVDRIVPAESDDPKYPRYTGVDRAVWERLATWPAEGLEEYRARFGPIAAAMLESAPHDRTNLNRVRSTYWATDAAKAASIRLIDQYLEAGEFEAARRTAQRLLDLHPALDDNRPAVLLRAGMADHFAGNGDAAQKILGQLQADHPDATGTVAGESVNLVDALNGILRQPTPRVHQALSDSWPTFGGGPDRAMLSASDAKPGTRLHSHMRAQSGITGGRDEVRIRIGNGMIINGRGAARARSRASEPPINIFPVADDGELFFQDGQRIFGLSLDSGQPLPGWMQTYSADANRAFNFAARDSDIASPLQQYHVTVSSQHVIAVMGAPDPGVAEGMPTQFSGGSSSSIICLDRKSGRQLWSFTASQLPEDNQKAMQFTGSPLVDAEHVYVVGRATRQGFEDCYLICVDLANGQLRWSTYLAGSVTGNFMGEAMSRTAPASPAMSGGRVVVATNVGAVASVDAHNGSIAWLTTYPRSDEFEGAAAINRIRFNGGGEINLKNVHPWAAGPAVVTGGHAFVLPSDGRHLLVFEVGTGQIVQRIALEDVMGADAILGVRGDMIVLSGDSVRGTKRSAFLLGIDWRKYNSGLFTSVSQDPSVVFWRELSGQTRGRGFLTGQRVYLPTSERLFCLSLDEQRMDDQRIFPPYSRGSEGWQQSRTSPLDDESPGNLVVVGDHVVIAGPRKVDVYTDLAAAREKLDREIAANPNDAALRLKYSEMMFAAGDVETSLAKIDEAIALLGGAESLSPGIVRDHLYNDALTFGQKLAVPWETRENALSWSRAFLNRAEKAASSAEQQVSYRLARADLASRQSQYIEQVRYYQEILNEPTWRAVERTDEQGESVQAGTVARDAIDKLIIERGPEVYNGVANVAEEAFALAKESRDVDALVRVATSYPNSTTASRAMLDAADVYESQGRHRDAARMLRQLYLRDPRGPHRNTVVESLARNHARIPGGLDVAIGRLAMAVDPQNNPKLTRPMKLPDGRVIENVTFAAALDELRKQSAQMAARSLPNLKIPPRPRRNEARKQQQQQKLLAFKEKQPTIENVALLAVPLTGYERYDRVVTWSPQTGLSIYAVGATSPLATLKPIEQEPQNVAWMGKSLLVWTPDTLYRIDDGAESAVWSFNLRSLPLLDAQPNESGIRRPVAPFAGRRGRVLVRGGRIHRLPAGVVEEAIDVDAEAPAPGETEVLHNVRPSATRIVASTSHGRVFALDSAAGTLAWQYRLARQAPSHLITTEEFTVVRTVVGDAKHLVALDTHSGQIVRRRKFEAGDAAPVNVALSSDGTLVYTLPTRIVVQDLYEQGHIRQNDAAEDAMNGAPFAQMTQPDHLLITQGLILALANQGTSVEVVDLWSGKRKGILQTGANEQGVSMVAVGSQLYTIAPRKVKCFELDGHAPREFDRILYESNWLPNVQEAVVGQSHLVLLDIGTHTLPADKPPTRYRVLCYSRQRVNNTESGLLEHYPTITDPSGITAWQAVEGGLYYLTGDRALHFLPGAEGT